ncbi:MAG: repressor LexA [Tepidanaerobacteraceae bacterium]|nr:repressor LexA [Tepidanaerobacteraceae bacterium]
MSSNELNTIGDRIKYLREKNNVTQQQLADATGLERGNLSHYEKNKIKPSAETIVALARFFKVSTDWLLTGQEPDIKSHILDIEPSIYKHLTDENKKNAELYMKFLIWQQEQAAEHESSDLKVTNKPYDYLKEKEEVYLPLLGESAAGKPILIDELLEGYIPVPKNIAKDKAFLVKAKGDSMIEAGIDDGDLVVIRPQPIVEEGEIALIRINNESTIKYFHKKNGLLLLKPANPKYSPIEVNPSQESVTVVGKVVFVIKKEVADSQLRHFYNE